MQKYIFKAYNPNFPQLFLQEKARIEKGLFGEPVQIEHIGSTAIIGLGGKGIIDIGIATAKFNFGKILQKLQALGYEFRPSHSTPERLFFRADLADEEEGQRRYHIHLTLPTCKEWHYFLSFRDYLLQHPKALAEYAQLKAQAAAQGDGDGLKYRKLKEPFFRKIFQAIDEVS